METDSGVGQDPPNDTGNSVSGPTMDADEGVDDTNGLESEEPPIERSYFIAESIDFTGNGCENDDVNDVTSTLRSKLDSEGWSGTRAVDGQTTPTDFIDASLQPFGLDYVASDAVSFAVYAGHGFMDQIQWGTADDDPAISPSRRCSTFLSSDVRLGARSGGWAKNVALLTSCTGRLACYESSLGQSDATQMMAFNNSPVIWGNAARRFYRKSGRMPNRDAWIRAMDNRPGIGKNSPVVYTRGGGRDEVLEIHQSARLSEISEIPRTQDTTWYAYTWVDHGLGDSCEPLLGSCVGVDD